MLCVANIYSQVTINTNVNQTGTPMSPDLIGAFFEDINYGADGGLYAELIQNRSFEYFEYPGYTYEGPLAHWALVQKGGAVATMAVENIQPLNENNTNYLKLNITNAGSDAGFQNSGYFGIHVEGGKNYNFSVYLRCESGFTDEVFVRLENSTGGVLGSDTIKSVTTDWEKYSLKLLSNSSSEDAVLTITTKGTGTLYADMVSLFPEETFKNRENGLRKDLAQVIADLNPKFLRFPGGCVSHGRGLDNAYRWKETIGDVAERKPNWNLWNYHQTYGLGFFEFFQYCEDIGAKPLPVLPVGISCQFRDREIEPIKNMGPWIQDAIDLIEFANGDVSTEWGSKRAEMGHPDPFKLEYICLGNEEDDIPEFRTRFIMFKDTIRKYHPEIKIIGTSGTDDSGGYYTSLWQFSKEQELDAVDEHYYNDPQWFLDNTQRYDHFDRNGPKVFIGEYASWDDRLYNAICEASYLTGVERNADVIQFTCYAPLLNYVEDMHYHWHPDMILFNNTSVVKTANYYVQQLFGKNSGDEYLPSTILYDEGNQFTQDYSGQIGVATWSTQAVFDNIKVVSGDKVWFEEDFSGDLSMWNVLDGTFALSSGTYAQSGGNTPAWSIATTPIDTSEYTITLQAMKTGGAEGFLIPFAFQDAQNYYWLNIAGWGNTQHALEKCTNGSKTQLATLPGSINTNQWYDIKIEVSNSGTRFYLDNELLFEVAPPVGPVTASVIKDHDSNDVIMKLVNSSAQSINSTINIDDAQINETADLTVLTGISDSRNTIQYPNVIVPVESTLSVSNSFNYQLPAYSLNVIRFSAPTTSVNDKHLTSTSLQSNIKIIPNPVVDYMTISFTELTTINSVQLIGMQGQIYKQLNNTIAKNIVVERDDIPAGTYIVKIVTGDFTYSGKVIFL